MKNLQRIASAIALSSALAISSALAGSIETTTDNNGQFGISISNLYLQPSANNLVYAVHTSPVPLPDPNWQQKIIDPSYQPTFAVGLFYKFADKVDQIKLDWLYLNSHDSASDSATGDESTAPPYYFGPFAQKLRNSSSQGNVQFNLNNVNLVFDHTFIINNHFQLSPFVGIGGAYLKQNFSAGYSGESADSGGTYYPYAINAYNQSKFIGAGPRLGLAASGQFGEHFSIMASLAGTVMAGSMDSYTHFLSYGLGNTTPTATTMADISQTKIIPELDSKLALAYDWAFQSGSNLSLQLGYLFSTYLDGIDQVVPTALVPNAFNGGVIAIETSAQQQSNFSLNGPFIKLSWLF